MIFEDGTDIYFARQLVNERIQEARGQLPPGVEPAMGPIATGLGEIFMWTVEAEAGRAEAGRQPVHADGPAHHAGLGRSGRSCATCPGVTEVNTIGGYVKQFHVTPDPAKLSPTAWLPRRARGARRATTPTSAPAISSSSGEQYLIRAPGQVADLDDIRDIIVGNRAGRADPHAGRRGGRCWARSCAPARPPRTATRSCSAPCSC